MRRTVPYRVHGTVYQTKKWSDRELAAQGASVDYYGGYQVHFHEPEAFFKQVRKKRWGDWDMQERAERFSFEEQKVAWINKRLRGKR